MNIYINNEKIDFTLETEKTMGELLSSIEKWINEQGYTLCELKVEDKEYPLEDLSSWANTLLSQEKDIYLKALTIEQLKLDNLQIIHNYTSYFIEALRSGNLSLLNELLAEYPFIESSFKILLDDQDNSIKKEMAQILKESALLPRGESSEEQLAKALNHFIYLQTIIKSHMDEIENPIKSGEDTLQTILSLEKPLEEISIQLQSGDDSKAMNTIIRFSELFQKLIRIYSYLPGEEKNTRFSDLKSKIEEISDILKELTDALEAEDSVLMGDLVEYEILPKLKEIPSFS